jgi:Predicted hydrolase of the alpha/beta superfamily
MRRWVFRADGFRLAHRPGVNRRLAMRRLANLTLLSVTVTASTLMAPLAAQEVAPDPVPTHDTLMLASRALGETRRINVHVPRAYLASDTSRFPVLYMPDGGLDEDFPHVVNTIDSLIALGAIRPVIVVGVPNTQRRRDLTGPTRVATDSAIAPRVGGSAAFRGFWRDELVPAIDARYRTTSERAIVGESLAGLFIVETFFVIRRCSITTSHSIQASGGITERSWIRRQRC